MAGPAARGLAADTGIGNVARVGRASVGDPHPAAEVARPMAPNGSAGSPRQASQWPSAPCSRPSCSSFPAGAFLVWTLLNISERAAWRAAAVSRRGRVCSPCPCCCRGPMQPTSSRFFDRGSASWEPGPVLAAAFGLAFAMTLVAVPSRLGAVTAWGGVLVGIGAVLARSGDFGPGREVGHLGLAIVSLGAAVVIGVAVEGVRRVTEITGLRRVLVGLGGAAAVLVCRERSTRRGPGSGRTARRRTVGPHRVHCSERG